MRFKIIIVGILILLGNQNTIGQNMTIRGKIIDYETNNPIFAATVMEGRTMNGTLSKKDGTFEINMDNNYGIFEVHWPGCYSIKIINIPLEHKNLDFGTLKMVTNYREINTGPGIYYTVTEYDKECDNKMRKDVLKKYRIKILGKKIRPYFKYSNRLIFDFKNRRGKDSNKDE